MKRMSPITICACLLALTVSLSVNALDNTATEAPVFENVRQMPLEGGRNFRDLGGYKTIDGKSVKWGKLYRSGMLAKLTDADYEYLARRNIQTIIDFRTTQERENEPTQWRAGQPEHLAWNYDFEIDQEALIGVFTAPKFHVEAVDALLVDMYPGLAESQKAHYRALFANLVNDDSPLLFHCTAGKDRTGIAAALILTALGVDRQTITADYELSERLLDPDEFFTPSSQATEDERKAIAYFHQMSEKKRRAMLRTRGMYLDAVFDAMNKQHGSVISYIQLELGVTDQDLRTLKANYTE